MKYNNWTLSPQRSMADLSYDEYKTLWGQIEFGAMNLNCYRNTLGVDREEVAYYSDGFLDAVYCDPEFDFFNKENNAENFALYCSWCD